MKKRADRDYRYGYKDDAMADRPFKWRVVPLILAIAFLVVCWLFLTQKILLGHNVIENGSVNLAIDSRANWISETYDNIEWRTNEGNLQTYGAWDLEAHVWKSEFIMEWWPDIFYSPHWYLGMPLLKYYQSGFYILHIAVIKLFMMDPGRAANMIIIFGHLAATLATFLLCLRVSRRYFVSALAAFFLLANTFMSLRSYGWEPITVVFLALYPIGLLVFLKEPLRPFRFWMVIALTAAYLMHPLIWFALCMTMGIYLVAISVRTSRDTRRDGGGVGKHKLLTQYVILVLCSLLLGGFQSAAQFTYHQVTSGAHMGVKYLPAYHVPNNIITLKDFFFNPGDLKGPGPIVMLALFFLLLFTIYHIHDRRTKLAHHDLTTKRSPFDHHLLLGFAVVIGVMVLFYYMELFDLFPMNLVRSVQYHRIIPEFIVASAVVIAALSTILASQRAKVFYYITLISFVIGGLFIIYGIQTHWRTVDTITDKPEFINEPVPGRISMTYTEQSLSVRNSFTDTPQVYGYYEQGITNSYADELMSVSSGFHNTSTTVLYLRAANVGRVYVNREAGIRNEMLQNRLNGTLLFIEQNYRYAYYAVPIRDASFAQAVPGKEVDHVQRQQQGCRTIYQVEYCGSEAEEFVTKDIAERRYLQAYVDMLENPYTADADITMLNPDHYEVTVKNATTDTAVVVKYTWDKSFRAQVRETGEHIAVEKIGPDFMLLRPKQSGDYTIDLIFDIPIEHRIGAIVSVITLIGLIIYFAIGPRWTPQFPEGDMK